MPNPYLPSWEYIPDGEPRVFGERVYVYGSHDRAASKQFCDNKLKVWSANTDHLSQWLCHGDSFHTQKDFDHESDVDWTTNRLFAPDVIEKDGRYYLYAYIVNARGCVAVSDHPEGPFHLLSQYEYSIPENPSEDGHENGIFIDPGAFVDDDGRVYLYCGYLSSYAVELNAANMYEVVEGSYTKDIIPVEEPYNFFEACSLRKIGDTYYLIYSPKATSCLVYATSKSPLGPFTYRGVIVDNGIDYPGGNNHGSICKIKDQWYIFYHRMTNGTIMSRRGCVEKISILEDGSIPQVEMTSLGFDDYLNPYDNIKADWACVLTGGCFITEKNVLTRMVTKITDGCVIGYKYFEFGDDYSATSMMVVLETVGVGCNSKVHILLDHASSGTEIGVCEVKTDHGLYQARVNNVTGRHAVFLVVEGDKGALYDEYEKRHLFNLISFMFIK